MRPACSCCRKASLSEATTCQVLSARLCSGTSSGGSLHAMVFGELHVRIHLACRGGGVGEDSSAVCSLEGCLVALR